MSWGRDARVKIQHKLTGIQVESDAHPRSIHRNKWAAMAMLRGKVWSAMRGGFFAVKDQRVRSYTDEDFDRTDITEMPRHRWYQPW